MKIVKKLKEMGVRGYKINVIFEHDDWDGCHSTMDLFVADWDEVTLISLYKLFKYAQHHSYSDIFDIHESHFHNLVANPDISDDPVALDNYYEPIIDSIKNVDHLDIDREDLINVAKYCSKQGEIWHFDMECDWRLATVDEFEIEYFDGTNKYAVTFEED